MGRYRGVMVADPDDSSRADIAEGLRHAGWDVREAVDGTGLLKAMAAETFGAVVCEVSLPGVSGYQVCHELHHRHGAELVFVFISATRTEPADRVAGLLLGADDYLAKPVAIDELLIRLGRMFERSRSRVIHATHGLTARELDVLALLARGQRRAAIAADLYISPKTVGTHLERVFAKLGVHSVAEAVAAAYEHYGSVVEAVGRTDTSPPTDTADGARGSGGARLAQ